MTRKFALPVVGQDPPGPWVAPSPPTEGPGPRRGRGRVPRSLAVAVCFALSVAAVATGIRLAKSAHDPNAGKPAWAIAWDPRVASIASFVERTRGLRFRHPVAVEFLAKSEFVAWVKAEHDAAGGTAYVSPTRTDLTASLVVGAYNPTDRTVRVQGQELTPDVRVTLAHELTHALQDQTFDLDSLQGRSDDGGASAGLAAVLEGDAVTVERAYYESLSREEQFTVSSSEAGDAGLSAQSSDARLAGAYLPYVFGPQLIATLVASGGAEARDRALRHPPPSDLGVLDPALFLAGDDDPAKVPTPVPAIETAPDGAETRGTMGALNWYLTLSARVDPRLVARTIEEWHGDSYATYRRGQITCIDAVVHVRPVNAAEHLADVFSRWAFGNDPTVTVVGDDIHITTCESLTTGAAADAAGGSLRVIYARNQLVLDGIEAGSSASLAHCIADRALVELPVEMLTASPFVLPGDWADRVELYRVGCAG